MKSENMIKEKPESKKILKIPKRKFRFEEAGVLVAILILAILISFGSPYFLTADNLLRVGRQMAFIGILSVGMSFVIASGQIDISVARMITFITFVDAFLIRLGVNPWIAFILGMLMGVLCGSLNGGLTLFFNVHPMIITLGTSNLFWGLAVGLSNAKPIVLIEKTSTYFNLGQGKVFGIPAPFLVFIIAAIIGQTILKKTQYGRHVLAVGSNRQAALYAGINEKLIRLSTMILSGVMAGLAAGVVLSFFQAFDPNIGAGMEMSTIGATVIGGADLMGGYASVLGAFLGTLLIGLINNGLVLIGIGAYWNNFVTGAVIIIAVAVSAFMKARRK